MLDSSMEKIKVLFIEDVAQQFQYMSSELSPAEFEIRWIKDGEEAFNELAGKKIVDEVIVLDYILPGKNGIEILKALYESCEIYAVIFLTAHRTVENAIEAMRYGALDFFSKGAAINTELPDQIRRVHKIHTERLERVRFQKELRFQENLNRIIIDNFPNGITALFSNNLELLQLKGSLETLNIKKDSNLTGYLADNLLDFPVFNQLLPYLKDALAKKSSRLELQMKSTFLDVSIAPVYDDLGQVAQIVVSAIDISSRKTAEIALQESEHELREMNKIMIRDFDLSANAKLAHMLTIMQNQASEAYQLLENLLNWARSQRETIVPQPQNIVLTELIATGLKAAQSMAINKSIKLQNNFNYSQKAFADPTMISSVLRNLISNAIKFTSNGGTVSVSGILHDKFIEIKVADTGVGISDENLAKIFKNGQHFTTYGTDAEKGSGLGLMICKDFVEKNNGTIKVRSVQGKGTVFSFTLPLAD